MILRKMTSDFRAVAENDPAAVSALETFLFFTSLHAIWAHRVAHALHRAKIPLIPRMIAMLARVWSGVEIHPGAEIGAGLFIDHGSGVVIGETVELGERCVLFHNVTLGGTGKHHGKRHPTIGKRVLIGTGGVLLGPIRVGDDVKIGANSFIIMHDIPSNCTVVGTPGRIVKKDGRRVDLPLTPTVLSAGTRNVQLP